MKKYRLLTTILIFLQAPFFSSYSVENNENYTFSSLMKESALIVQGYVSSVESYEKSKGRIYSDIKFIITEVFEGDYDVNSTIEFTYLGGTVNEITTFVLELPQFSTNQKSILFLKKFSSKNNGPEFYDVVGASQGKFNISSDEFGNEVVKRDVLVDEELVLDDKISFQRLSNSEPMSLNEFIDRIENFLIKN